MEAHARSVSRHSGLYTNVYMMFLGIAVVMWIYAITEILSDTEGYVTAHCSFIREYPMVFHMFLLLVAVAIIWYEDQSLEELSAVKIL